MEIKIEKKTQFVYNVLTSSGKNIGTFELDESGFYNYWRNSKSDGAWQSWLLRAIADKLDDVNKPYKEVIDEYFDQEIRDREERARVGYRKLLNDSGMFFVFYPELTGDWKKDKLEWFVIHADLEDLIGKNSSL